MMQLFGRLIFCVPEAAAFLSLCNDCGSAFIAWGRSLTCTQPIDAWLFGDFSGDLCFPWITAGTKPAQES